MSRVFQALERAEGMARAVDLRLSSTRWQDGHRAEPVGEPSDSG